MAVSGVVFPVPSWFDPLTEAAEAYVPGELLWFARGGDAQDRWDLIAYIRADLEGKDPSEWPRSLGHYEPLADSSSASSEQEGR